WFGSATDCCIFVCYFFHRRYLWCCCIFNRCFIWFCFITSIVCRCNLYFFAAFYTNFIRNCYCIISCFICCTSSCFTIWKFDCYCRIWFCCPTNIFILASYTINCWWCRCCCICYCCLSRMRNITGTIFLCRSARFFTLSHFLFSYSYLY